MILSQTATYALKATLCLAEAGTEGPIRVDDVAERLGVPRNYLSKTLHVLARNRILRSTRGPGGGFQLAVPADQLSLADVIRHFDDTPDGSACLMGRERCNEADPCPAHARWKSVSASVTEFFEQTTVADLATTDLPASPCDTR